MKNEIFLKEKPSRSRAMGKSMKSHQIQLLSLTAVLLSILVTPAAWAGTFTNFTPVRSFLASDPSASPHAPVTEGSDGLLYGTTDGYALGDLGGVFKVGKDGGN